MLKYMRLQLFLISKKVSTYLIPVIFGIAFFLSIGLIILIAAPKTETLSHTSPMMYILPFIISAIFVAVKALNIFKDSEDDGTELLIVSKPITRVKIVLGKFLSLYTMIFLFAIFTFITAFLVAQCDEHASLVHKLEFAGSVAFGTLVIQFLLSSLIVFFASVMGKIGTMVLSILLPLVFTIVSMILLPISNSSLGGGYGNSNEFVTNVAAKDKSGKIIIKEVFGYDKNNKNAKEVYETHKKSWYSYAAYGDIWSQLSSFYTVFQEENPTTSSTVKWRESGQTKITSNFKFNYNSQEYVFKAPSNTSEEYISGIFDKAKQIVKNPNFIAKIGDAVPGLTVNSIDDLGNIIDSEIGGQNDLAIAAIFKELTTVTIKDSQGRTQNLPTFKNIDQLGGIIKMNQILTGLESHPYIPKSLLYAIWLGITFGVGGLVMLRYMRRDFK